MKMLIDNVLKMKRKEKLIEYMMNNKSPEDNKIPNKSKSLNTFFFGYFALKWRRLIRSLTLFPLILWILYGFILVIIDGRQFWEDSGLIFFLLIPLGFVVIIGFISWLIEPFVVEKK